MSNDEQKDNATTAADTDEGRPVSNRLLACCEDFERKSKIIDNVLTLHQLRNNVELPSIAFLFCPWCGSSRANAAVERSAPSLRASASNRLLAGDDHE